jgi:hypothetical protein
MAGTLVSLALLIAVVVNAAPLQPVGKGSHHAMDQIGGLNTVKSNETVAVLAQSGDKSNNQMTVSLKEGLNATADLETAPYAYSD